MALQVICAFILWTKVVYGASPPRKIRCQIFTEPGVRLSYYHIPSVFHHGQKIYNSEILGVESAESLVLLSLHIITKQRPLVEPIKRDSNLAVIVIQMYVGIIQT